MFESALCLQVPSTKSNSSVYRTCSEKMHFFVAAAERSARREAVFVAGTASGCSAA